MKKEAGEIGKGGRDEGKAKEGGERRGVKEEC